MIKTSIVNINTASISELKTLTGIGESKAKAIISYREKNGGFKSIDEIKTAITETVDIIGVIKPIYNFKAH